MYIQWTSFFCLCVTVCAQLALHCDTDRSCKECPPNCVKCLPRQNCSLCNPDNQHPDCPNSCSLCRGNCSRNGECLDGCLSGSFLKYGVCQECPTNCVNCSSDLLCRNCKSGFWGPLCEYSCSLCGGTCSPDKKRCLCKSGYYISKTSEGSLECEKCPAGCRTCKSVNGITVCGLCVHGFYHDSHTCQECPKTCKQGTCNERNGSCSDECIAGWSGTKCDKQCNSNCLQCHQANIASCVSCKTDYFGKACDRVCSSNCERVVGKSICDRNSGNCLAGCIPTWWGKKCEVKCSLYCNGTECDKVNGTCKYGCIEGYEGKPCSKEKTLAGTGLSTEDKDWLLIGLVVGLGLLVVMFVIGVIFYIVFKKRRQKQTENPSLSMTKQSIGMSQKGSGPQHKETPSSSAKLQDIRTYEDLRATRETNTEYEGLKTATNQAKSETNAPGLKETPSSSAKLQDIRTYEDLRATRETNTEYEGLKTTTNLAKSKTNPSDLKDEMTRRYYNKNNNKNPSEDKSLGTMHISSNNSQDAKYKDLETDISHDYLVLEADDDEESNSQAISDGHLEINSTPVYHVLEAAQNENVRSSDTDRTYHVLEAIPKEHVISQSARDDQSNHITEHEYHVLEIA